MPQDSQQLSVLIMHIEYEGPLPSHALHVDAAKVLEHPAGCGVLYRLFFLAWEAGLESVSPFRIRLLFSDN